MYVQNSNVSSSLLQRPLMHTFKEKIRRHVSVTTNTSINVCSDININNISIHINIKYVTVKGGVGHRPMFEECMQQLGTR